MTRAVDEDELIENWTLVGAELEPGRRAAWAGEAGVVLAGGLVVVPPVLGEDAKLAPGGGHARPGTGSARIPAVNPGRIPSSCRNAHSAGPKSGRGGNDRGAART